MKKYSSLIYPAFVLALLGLANVVNAQSLSGCNNTSASIGIKGIICKIVDIMNVLMPALVLFATVWFIYGVVRYIMAKDEEAQKEYRKVMINGIIGLFIILSVWGLVKVLQRTFGLEDNAITTNQLPGIY